MEPYPPVPSESEGLTTTERMGVVDEEATEQGGRLSHACSSYSVPEALTCDELLILPSLPFCSCRVRRL